MANQDKPRIEKQCNCIWRRDKQDWYCTHCEQDRQVVGLLALEGSQQGVKEW